MAWLVPRLIHVGIRLLFSSIRWEMVGDFAHVRDRPHILSFWHARMLMIPGLNRYRDWDGVMLISAHRDGRFIADAIRLFGIPTLHGSSTRGGARAFLRMVKLAEEGKSLGITPDGPRGPAEVAKPGVVRLARKTGLPLRPICYATRRHWRVRSWDRFYIPKPFTRGVFVLGDEVYADAADEEANLRKFQAAMDEVRRRADDYFRSRAA